MAKAILIIHGPPSEYKKEIVSFVKSFFDDYTHIETNNVKKVLLGIKGNILIVTESDESGSKAMNAYIDVPEKKYDPGDLDNLSIQSHSNKELSGQLAGMIIAQHKRWCSERKIPVTY